MWYNNIWWQIYDSRNYICIYTAADTTTSSFDLR